MKRLACRTWCSIKIGHVSICGLTSREKTAKSLPIRSIGRGWRSCKIWLDGKCKCEYISLLKKQQYICRKSGTCQLLTLILNYRIIRPILVCIWFPNEPAAKIALPRPAGRKHGGSPSRRQRAIVSWRPRCRNRTCRPALPVARHPREQVDPDQIVSLRCKPLVSRSQQAKSQRAKGFFPKHRRRNLKKSS